MVNLALAEDVDGLDGDIDDFIIQRLGVVDTVMKEDSEHIQLLEEERSLNARIKKLVGDNSELKELFRKYSDASGFTAFCESQAVYRQGVKDGLALAKIMA